MPQQSDRPEKRKEKKEKKEAISVTTGERQQSEGSDLLSDSVARSDQLPRETSGADQ